MKDYLTFENMRNNYLYTMSQNKPDFTINGVQPSSWADAYLLQAELHWEEMIAPMWKQSIPPKVSDQWSWYFLLLYAAATYLDV